MLDEMNLGAWGILMLHPSQFHCFSFAAPLQYPLAAGVFWMRVSYAKEKSLPQSEVLVERGTWAFLKYPFEDVVGCPQVPIHQKEPSDPDASG